MKFGGVIQKAAKIIILILEPGPSRMHFSSTAPGRGFLERLLFLLLKIKILQNWLIARTDKQKETTSHILSISIA